jgi:hypothetical protein
MLGDPEPQIVPADSHVLAEANFGQLPSPGQLVRVVDWHHQDCCHLFGSQELVVVSCKIARRLFG